jgi:hypothetical protein
VKRGRKRKRKRKRVSKEKESIMDQLDSHER